MKKLIMMMALMMCFAGLTIAQKGTIYVNKRPRSLTESGIIDNKVVANEIKIKDGIVHYTFKDEFVRASLPLSSIDSIIYSDSKIYYSPSVFTDARDLEVYNIRYNLNKMYKQYNTGTTCIISGTLITTMGILFTTNNNSKFGLPLSICGGILSLTGYIIQIDSHKYLKRASIQYGVTPMSATIKLKF
jgi:hypothetical protein